MLTCQNRRDVCVRFLESRPRAPREHASFLGVVVVMANQCLMLVAIFGSEGTSREDGEKRQTDDVFATFMFFLFASARRARNFTHARTLSGESLSPPLGERTRRRATRGAISPLIFPPQCRSHIRKQAVYAFFASLLATFRNDLIKEPPDVVDAVLDAVLVAPIEGEFLESRSRSPPPPMTSVSS